MKLASPARPRVFVASSSEALPVARAIQANLERSVEATVWDQGAFRLSSTALESLGVQMQTKDAAIFVLAADDVILLRGRKQRMARDNVIFELGMFVGKLGLARCFMVVPDGGDVRIPNDLAGITYATYTPDRSDRNLRAALGPACDQILAQILGVAATRDQLLAHDSFQTQGIPWEEYFGSSASLDILCLGSSTWRSHHFLRLQHFVQKPNASICVLLPNPCDSELLREVANGWDGDADAARARIDSAVRFFADLSTANSRRKAVQVFGIDQVPRFSLFQFERVGIHCCPRRLESVSSPVANKGA